MAGSMKKILTGWNDTKRRAKVDTTGTSNDVPHYSEMTRPIRPPPTPLSTSSRYGRSRNGSSSSSSSSYSSSTPVTPTHEYDQLRDSEDDTWGPHDHSLSYRSTSSERESSSGHEDDGGDVDVDAEERASLLREWRTSPPSRFQMKRTGKGSRGRARPPAVLILRHKTSNPKRELGDLTANASCGAHCGGSVCFFIGVSLLLHRGRM